MKSFNRNGGQRLLALAAAFLGAAGAGLAQQSSCVVNTTIPTVHVEGLTEKIGDITLLCTGGTPGTLVGNPNLFINVAANITNRLNADNTLAGITITVNNGTTTVISPATVTLYSSVTAAVSGLQYTVPQGGGAVTIRISGIRVAIPLVPQTQGPPVLTANVIATGVQITNGQLLIVATYAPSLLTSVNNNGLTCAGSALPATLDFPSFIGVQASSSTIRVTEAQVNAFQPKDAASDTGTRIVVKLSGYGPSARLFAPDAIVGNTGSIPTSAGAYSSSIYPGQYAPNLNQLLLSRVKGADVNGVGGTLVLQTPVAGQVFGSVSEIPVTGGAGYAVYEVVDSNPTITESAQIPVFAAFNQNDCATSANVSLTAFLGPVSTVATATMTDPVPRYAAAVPGNDCTQVGDCNAAYFPKLQVIQSALNLTAPAYGAAQTVSIQVGNNGGGQLPFKVSATYPAGSTVPFLTSINPVTGLNNQTITLVADPANLSPGVYQATVTIDAGTAGVVNVPVTFTVTAPGVTIQSVVNAANSQPGPVAPGSFVAIYGLNLAGNNVQVLFNGLPGTVYYDGASQINTLIPAALAGLSTVNAVVYVNGQVSNTFKVSLTANAPVIFNPGILNQDNSVNLANQPASRGDYIQIFLTGLTTPVVGPVTVDIGDQTQLVPVYAGASSIAGLEQVNVQIPLALTVQGGSANVTVCIPGTSVPRQCSPAVPVYVK